MYQENNEVGGNRKKARFRYILAIKPVFEKDNVRGDIRVNVSTP